MSRRIRRDRQKVIQAAVTGRSPGRHDLRVTVRTWRYPTGHYRARACIGPVAYNLGHAVKCGREATGRTPQSAIAKALKRLSGKIARRHRFGSRRS